jgi:hypothetical protein
MALDHYNLILLAAKEEEEKERKLANTDPIL